MTAEGAGTRASALAIGLAVIAVLVAVGTPLLGLDVFAGTDLLEGFAPWDEVPPDGEVTNPLVSDLVDSSLPDRHEAVSRLRDGDLPLWQPYANGGRPLAALPNLGLASPLNWPYLVLPLWYAPGVVQLLTMLVSLVGGLAWLRRAGLGGIAATLGAVTLTLSGYAVVYAGFPAGHIAALLPLGLWATDVAVDPTRSATVRVLPLAGVVATMWFEGFPQVTAFAVGTMGAWAVAVVADRRHDPVEHVEHPPRAWSIVVPLVAVVLGTLLAAVQLLPFAADTGQLDLSAREQSAEDHLPLGTAATVLAPDALGTATDGDWFGPLNELEVQSAIAVPALALALVGLVATPRRRRWRTAALAGLGAVAALLTWVGGPLLALAQTTPLFALADVHRVRLLVVVAVAWLAAQGLDAVVRGVRPSRGRLAGLGGLAVVGGVAGALVVRSAHRLATDPAQVTTIDRRVLVGIAWVVVVGIVVAVTAWRPRWRTPAALALVALTLVLALPLPLRFWPRTDPQLFYPETPTHAFLEAELGHDRLLTDGLVLLPGTTTYYGLRTAAAHAFPTPEWRDLLEAVDPEVYARLSPTFPAVALTPAVAASPVLDRMSVRHLVVDDERDRWPTDGDHRVALDDVATTVYENTTVLPRIRWAGRAEVVADDSARVARLASGELPRDTVVLSEDPDVDAAGAPAELEVLRDGGDTIEVAVDAGGSGWLVVADTLDDWTATVDGVAAEVVEADHAFGAVHLDEGAHRVVLSYTPAGWRTGVWVSGGTLVALLAIGVLGRRRVALD